MEALKKAFCKIQNSEFRGIGSTMDNRCGVWIKVL
jgi:hypothetical protein